MPFSLVAAVKFGLIKDLHDLSVHILYQFFFSFCFPAQTMLPPLYPSTLPSLNRLSSTGTLFSFLSGFKSLVGEEGCGWRGCSLFPL